MTGRSRTGKKLAASAAILAAVGSFVSFGVFSAFSDTKSNSSSLSSAAFSITQLPGTSSLLSAITNLIPGDFLQRCVTITNASGTPADIKIVPSISGALSPVLTMTIQEIASQGATAGDCTGAGANQGAALVSGVAGSALTAGGYSIGNFATSAAKHYRIRVDFPAASITSDADTVTYSGKSATLGVNFVATQSSTGADRS